MAAAIAPAPAPTAPPTKPSAAPAPAPAPKPAAAPVPAPKPAPAPTPSNKGREVPAPAPDNENPFAEIEAKFAKAEEPKPTTGGKTAAPKKEPAAEDEFKGVPPKFRAEYERVKTEHQTNLDKVSALETKIAEAEARGKDVTALTARLEEMEKRAEAQAAELRMAKNEMSPEFKDKWEKPFDEEADFARADIGQMSVLNDLGEPERPATWDDFVELYRLPPQKAIEQAEKMFGKASRILTDHLTVLRRLDRGKEIARKAELENYKARQTEEEGKQATQREQVASTWKRVNEELAETVDEYKDPVDDKELGELRQTGYRLFDARPKTMQQKIVKDAHIRQIVASHGPNKLKIVRLQKELEEAKAALDSYKNPQPGAGKRAGGADPAPPTSESWEDEARRSVT